MTQTTLIEAQVRVASPPSRRSRRGGEATAARILEVAEELFAERGFAGTTLRDVAARVGVRNPSIYNHFPSKDALYEAVLSRGIGPILGTLTEFVEAGPAAYSDPRAVIERLMAVLAEHPYLPRLVLHETLAGGPRLTPLLGKWITATFARGYEMVAQLPAARRWGEEQVPLLVLAMYHIVIGYFTVAPVYGELSGEDLMSDAARERQTAFLCRLVEKLFLDERKP
jgi:AcrR family transcriptional regulator